MEGGCLQGRVAQTVAEGGFAHEQAASCPAFLDVYEMSVKDVYAVATT